MTVDQEWSTTSQPIFDRNTPKCAACGCHHTEPGVTHESAELTCLRRTVKRQREEIASLKIEMEALRRR